MSPPAPEPRNAGLAAQAARRMLWRAKVLLLAAAVCGLGALVGRRVLSVPTLVLAMAWLAAGAFILYFFRDPDPRGPAEPDWVVAPAHGRVDVVEEDAELDYLGGRCRRVSIFLSVFDVHVQNAPVAGEVEFTRHTPGRFTNALSPASALRNENLLLGIRRAGILANGLPCG